MAVTAVTFLLAAFTLVTAASDSICSTEKIGDTVKSNTNFRLQLPPVELNKQYCYIPIPELPYCQISGAALTVCDPVAAPQLYIMNFTAAVVIRNSDSQPASQKMILYCRFDK